MKVFTQIVAPLVVIVGLVAGVTFVRQYTAMPTTPTGPPATLKTPGEGVTSSDAVHLYFPQTVVEWNPDFARIFEADTPGHYEYWFESKVNEKLRIGVFAKNCRCSKVEVCAFTPDEGKKFHAWSAASRAALVGQGVGGWPELLAQGAVAEKASGPLFGVPMKWQALELDDTRTKSLDLPEQAVGLVRLSWTPKKANDERLKAELWTQAHVVDGKPSPPAFVTLELPVKFVPPLLADPVEGVVGDLYPGGDAKTNFVCWSATRTALPVRAVVLNREDKPDPCFRCTVTPLTQEEANNLSQSLHTRVLTAYRVEVDIRERVSDTAQLDLGPFRRRLTLVSDPDVEPATPLIAGVVRGEIAVGTEDDRDRIALGSFKAVYGGSKTIQVTAERPQVQLSQKDIEVEPEFLEARLKPVDEPKDGRAHWELTVRVPAGRTSGVLPPNAAVYIKVQGNPPRRIRIPVSGNAYQ